MSALWRMDNYLCNAKLETKEETEGGLVLDDQNIKDFTDGMTSKHSRYNEETLKQYIKYLRNLKRITDCQDLTLFDESHWKALNKFLFGKTNKTMQKSISYGNGLKSALKKFWEIKHVNIAQDKPFWCLDDKAGVIEDAEEADKKLEAKRDLMLQMRQDFKKIYAADLMKTRKGDIDGTSTDFLAKRNKAIFCTNYYMLGRRMEVSRVRVQDLDFENKGIKVRVSKPKPDIRVIPIPEDSYWQVMKEYLAARVLDGTSSEYLFYSTRSETKDKKLSPSSISLVANKIGRKVYGRHVWSHFLRYARSSVLGETLTPDELQYMGRWSDVRTPMKFYRDQGLINRSINKKLKKKAKDGM